MRIHDVLKPGRRSAAALRHDGRKILSSEVVIALSSEIFEVVLNTDDKKIDVKREIYWAILAALVLSSVSSVLQE